MKRKFLVFNFCHLLKFSNRLKFGNISRKDLLCTKMTKWISRICHRGKLSLFLQHYCSGWMAARPDPFPFVILPLGMAALEPVRKMKRYCTVKVVADSIKILAQVRAPGLHWKKGLSFSSSHTPFVLSSESSSNSKASKKTESAICFLWNWTWWPGTDWSKTAH